MAEDGRFEDWVQAAEEELLDPSTPNPRTGLILLRMWRKWHATEWEPHNRREEELRGRIERYIWGARLVLALLGALGGFIAFSIHTLIDLATVLKVGAGGP